MGLKDILNPANLFETPLKPEEVYIPEDEELEELKTDFFSDWVAPKQEELGDDRKHANG